MRFKIIHQIFQFIYSIYFNMLTLLYFKNHLNQIKNGSSDLRATIFIQVT